MSDEIRIQPHPPAERGVRIEHVPSGLVAICVHERTQRRNRVVALDMIMAGLTSPGHCA